LTETTDDPGSSAGGANAALLRASMPQAMRALPQWLMWRFERFDGDKKPRKVPYYLSGHKRRGVQGSPEDRAELCEFDAATAALKAGRWDGVGFAFLPGDGLIGIDIDGAVDPDTGEVSERCRKIIEACSSYTEWSPSGRGVHIIVAGQSETFKDNKIGLEIFCGRQFFTCTGRRWQGTPAEVEPLQEDVLRRLRATVRGKKGEAPAATVSAPAPAPAGDKAQRARRYCLAALDNAVQRVQRAQEGGRNNELNEAAFGLAQLVHTGGVSEATIRAALGDAARSIGLVQAEIDATLRSAISAGLLLPKLLPAEPERAPARGRGKKARSEGVAADGTPTPSTGSAAEDAGADAADDADWRTELIRERGGKKDCRENVFLVLRHHPALQGLVAYDEFAHRVMKTRQPPWDSTVGEWSTQDDYLLGMWLATHERMVIKAEGTLVAGVAMAAFQNRYHPVLRYLAELPDWDGVPRLAHWLHECLGAKDTPYTQLVGTWFVLGMVQRVQVPGCQMDYMIVLEGLQGKRKSTALRTLVGNDDWFADTPIRIGDKDAMLSLAGKWLYEVGELDSFNKAEVTAVKQYVSSRVDRVREPFARRPADRPRSGVFAGSTNQSEYFKDPTGARRFWPVACDGDIDIDKLAQWRSQLFAEAMHRLASADPEDRRYYPTREETDAYLVPEQEAREIVDPWFERLAQWLDCKQQYGDSGREVREVDSFTAHDLLTKCLMVPQDRIDGGRQMATRVGIAMHKMHWHKRRDATGARLWRYWRPGSQTEETGQTEGAAGGPAVELHEF
jgi:predicted P-loop ATPase